MTTGAGGRPAGVVPWRGVWRQSRRDAAPLAVGMVVVAAAAFLSCAVPQALDAAATSEVRAALSAKGEPVSVVVEVPVDYGNGPDLGPADSAASVKDRIEAGMPVELRSVLTGPVTALIGPELKAGAIAGRPGRVRFTYVSSASGPAVDWVEGSAPAATGGSAWFPPDDGRPVPVEVAMSQAAAELMGVHPGTKLTIDSTGGQPLDVRLTGIYRATDPGDDAWAVAPTLLKPQLIGGSAALASIGLLTSAESLPFAQFAVYPTGMSRTYTYRVVPSGLDARRAAEVATLARGLASGRKVFDLPGVKPIVTTQLDRVVGAALARVDAAGAQASVLLIGLLAAALLVELLASALVIERRAAVLAQWRSRGASLPSIGLANAAESTLLAATAGMIGVVAANIAVGGVAPWTWILPPLVAAALPQPVLAMRTAGRATGAPRLPAGRLSPLTAAQVRRLGSEAMLVLLALATLATLIVRGVTASAGSVWSDVVVLAAPVLVALATALGLVRAWPGLLRVVRAATARGAGAVTLLAAARTRASGLATAALVTAAAVAAIAASVAGTVSQGQLDAAWDAVGADAVATTTAPGGLPRTVAALDGSRGLTVATATTIPDGQVIGSQLDSAVTIVAVDAAAMARLLASSPAPDAPALAALTVRGTGADGALPMLITGGQGPESATLRWGDDSVSVRPVGDASALPTNVTGTGIVAVVDRELLAAAVGHEIAATRAWAVGAGAETGLVATLGSDPDASVATRAGWLAEQANAPVTLALGWLFTGAGAVATVLAALAVALMAASGSWERTRAAAQTRVLGLQRPAAARIAWLEATVPAVVASAVGVAVGIGLASPLVAALDLRSVTGGRETPHLVVGWWSLAIPLALGLVARIAVAVAALSHRGERLGPLLRAG